ncbi:MAG: T9SS type A sorting domain-containing protein [Bacteroidales bacterium]|nr:T9SS type A sorting domain-containing protein [Bacteroidales bacterium]
MKKIILTLSFLISAIAFISAQSLSLWHQQNEIINGDEITIFGDSTSTNTIYAYVDVKNNTNSDVDVKVKKVEMSLVQGSQNFFCWQQCYTPATYVSPVSVTIPANTTTDDFDGEYMPKGNLGESKIKYVFFLENDTTDSAAVIVNYMATPVGIEQEQFKPELSDAFPNPANEKVSFKYDLRSNTSNAKVILRNMIGSVVKEIRLTNNSGEVSIDTYELNEGVYFYSYILEDKVHITKKLVIQH